MTRRQDLTVEGVPWYQKSSNRLKLRGQRDESSESFQINQLKSNSGPMRILRISEL